MQTLQPKLPVDPGEMFIWNAHLLPSIPGPTLPIIFLINTNHRIAYAAQELCVTHAHDIDDDDIANESQVCDNPIFTIRIPHTTIDQILTPFCICDTCCKSHLDTIIRIARHHFPNQKQNQSSWEQLDFAYQHLPEILSFFAKQIQVETLILCNQARFFQGESMFPGWDQETLRKKLKVQIIHAGAMPACQYIRS
jgi:hypothetical protein